MKSRFLLVLLLLSFASLIGQTATPDELRELTGKMDAAQVQEAIQILREHYVRSEQLEPVELERAMLEGLLARMEHGAHLSSGDPESNDDSEPALAEILRDEVAYFRPITLDSPSEEKLHDLLKTANEAKIDALILDLRFIRTPGAYADAAKLLTYFAPKGATLFSVSRGGDRPAETFSGSRNPLWDGVIVVITDDSTQGAGEVLAAVLQTQGALVLGEATPGAALRYEPFLLANGMVLRVGVGEVTITTGDGEGTRLTTVEPDLFFPIPPSMKEEAEEERLETSLERIAYDEPRPRFNEAALVAGGNPELDALQKRQEEGEKAPAMIDRQLQRAIDLARATAILGN